MVSADTWPLPLQYHMPLTAKHSTSPVPHHDRSEVLPVILLKPSGSEWLEASPFSLRKKERQMTTKDKRTS